MTRLLQIDASPRGERSHTRRLSREFVEHLQTADPGTKVVYRDIGRQPLPHVTEDLIAAAFTPPDQRDDSMHKSLQLSDELVGELQAANLIVLGMTVLVLAIHLISFFLSPKEKAKIEIQI